MSIKMGMMLDHGGIRMWKRMHWSKVGPIGPYRAGIHMQYIRRRRFSWLIKSMKQHCVPSGFQGCASIESRTAGRDFPEGEFFLVFSLFHCDLLWASPSILCSSENGRSILNYIMGMANVCTTFWFVPLQKKSKILWALDGHCNLMLVCMVMKLSSQIQR